MTTEKPSNPVPQPREYAWLGLAERVPTNRGTVRLKILWGRIAALMFLLFVMAWMSAATGLYFFFKNVRNFENVAYGDMVLFPFKRDAVREAQGNYEIEQALLLVEEGNFRRAVGLARQGTARAPRNVEGRMLLARVYAGFRSDLSIEILESGLQHARDNLDYVRLLVQLLLQEKEDERVLELQRTFVPEGEDAADITTVLALGGMRAAVARGKFEHAINLFEEHNLWRNIEGVTLAARLLQRIGEVDRATELLLEFVRVFQNQPIEVVHSTLLRILIEEERFADAVDIALERTFRNPLEWQPRIDLINIYHRSDRQQRVEREAFDIARQFRTDERAMAALAQFATDSGNIRLSRRVYETALENNHSLALFGLLFIEAHLTAGEFEAAIRFCNELAREQPGWLAEYEGVFSSMRAIAQFGVGNEELGRVYLREFLDSPRVSVALLSSVARRFEEINRPGLASRLLNEAMRRDPNDENVLSTLVELELRLGESRALVAYANRLLELRRPSYSLVERLRDSLSSDRFIFAPEREQLVQRLDAVLDERLIDTSRIRIPDLRAAEEAAS